MDNEVLQQELADLSAQESKILEKIALEQELADLEEAESNIRDRNNKNIPIPYETTPSKEDVAKSPDLVDAFTRGAKRTALGLAKGALYLPDKAADIIRVPVNTAISMTGGPKGYLKPTTEVLEKFVDDKGELKPRNKLEEYEDIIAEGLGGAISGAGLGNVLSKGASAAAQGVGKFIQAGTQPTTANLVATAAIPSAIKYASDRDAIIPLVGGAASIYGAKKGKDVITSPEMANRVGKLIDFKPEVFEKLNSIPGWDKVQTLGDYIGNQAIKKIENQLRKVPFLGSALEKRALKKGEMFTEALGQQNVDPSDAGTLAYKGVNQVEAKYFKEANEHLNQAVLSETADIPLRSTNKEIEKLGHKFTSDAAEDLKSLTNLGPYSNIIKRMQLPAGYTDKVEKLNKYKKDLSYLPENQRNQAIAKLEGPTWQKEIEDVTKGSGQLSELLFLRTQLGKDINWSKKTVDVELKNFYHSINKDLGSYFSSIGKNQLEHWKQYNQITHKYFREHASTVNKIQNLYTKDDKFKAFVNSLPEASSAREAKTVMEGLGDEAPDFFKQIVGEMGRHKDQFDPLKFEQKWSKLARPVKNELLDAANIHGDHRKYVNKIIDSIQDVKTTLTQNLNTSESSTFETAKKTIITFGSIPYLLATGATGVAAGNAIALAAVKGASNYIFANPKFSAWIYRGMHMKNAQQLDKWSKGIKNFPDAPDKFKSYLSTITTKFVE